MAATRSQTVAFPPRVRLEPFAQGFTAPVVLLSPGDGTRRLFLVDQIGLIWVIDGGVRQEHPFLDLRDRLVNLSEFYDERGLLGLAFHPDFARNRRFFVYYSAPLKEGLSPDEWDHTSRVSEFLVSAKDPGRADPGSERILLEVNKPGYNYEGGHIAFGPDGTLYIAMGDSVRQPDQEAGLYAQDPSSLLGKILRIDVEGSGSYRIPPDNPFAAGGGRPEIYAYGLRNPYRFSFDPHGDQFLLAADVGHALMEEVDLIVKGGNYGWPVREGFLCFNAARWTEPLERCASEGAMGEPYLDPLIAYRHSQGRSAVIGGLVYRGRRIPDLYGSYVFGDWGRGEGRLFAARPTEESNRQWPFAEIPLALPEGQQGLGQLLGFGQDAEYELYVLVKEPRGGPVGDSGLVYRIVPGSD